jgi:hypothetical protein
MNLNELFAKPIGGLAKVTMPTVEPLPNPPEIATPEHALSAEYVKWAGKIFGIDMASGESTTKFLLGEGYGLGVDRLQEFVASNQPFSLKSLEKYPFLAKMWEDVCRVNAEWYWSKICYQGWRDVHDYGGEIRTVRQGDILGCLLYANGIWRDKWNMDELGNMEYDLAQLYTGCTSEFVVGLGKGYDQDTEYRDYPGYFEGYSIANWQREQATIP